MNEDFVYFTFMILVVFSCFNLWLTFRLIRIVKYLRLNPTTEPVPLPTGSQISVIKATAISDNNSAESWLPHAKASVFLYLSSACDKCQSKLPQLNQICELADCAGVEICLLTAESTKVFCQFLSFSNLTLRGWQVSQQDYDHLNPQGATPFYQFVNEQGVIQASGLIGDENWLGFVDQIRPMDKQAP